MNDTTPSTTELQKSPCASSSSAEWLQEMLHKVRAQLDDLQASARDQARTTARNTDHLLHSHPYRAVGMAAAAGLLVGFLASRR